MASYFVKKKKNNKTRSIMYSHLLNQKKLKDKIFEFKFEKAKAKLKGCLNLKFIKKIKKKKFKLTFLFVGYK